MSSVHVLGSIIKIPKIISNSFGRLKKGYNKLSISQSSDSKSSNSGSIRRSYEKIKKNLKTHFDQQIKKHVSSSRMNDDKNRKTDGHMREKLRKFNNITKKFSINKIDRLFKKKSSHVIVTQKIPFETLHGKIGSHFKTHWKPNEQITPSKQPDIRE